MLPEPIGVTLQVVEALERLGVRYLIGGSLASALYGVARSTADADLLADLRPEHIDHLAQALQGDFYIDPEAVREAARRRSSFNVIHLSTMFKVDIFVARRRPFDRVQLRRRRKQIVATEPERSAYFASPEDTVLTKLEWYQLGGQLSDRQWRDVLDVLKEQQRQLDVAYLRQWAAALDVSALLERALADAGLADASSA
jgi:hypothetical protein